MKNFEVKQASAISLPFPDNYFDAVFAFAALHHISQWQAVVKEIARVLKPNGIFYFKEFLKDVFQIPLIGPLYKWIDGPAGLFSEKELKMK